MSQHSLESLKRFCCPSRVSTILTTSLYTVSSVSTTEVLTLVDLNREVEGRKEEVNEERNKLSM